MNVVIIISTAICSLSVSEREMIPNSAITPFTLNSQEWLAANFSSQYHFWINCKGHENDKNDH